MFIHSVLFEIAPKEVRAYYRDCRMWAAYAKKAKGFLGYFTMKRVDTSTTLSVNPKNQYASVYEWQARHCHERFMRKYHDALVHKSKARVKVLGYYNLRAVDEIRRSLNQGHIPFIK